MTSSETNNNLPENQSAPEKLRSRLPRQIMLIAVVILALIPPSLVVADRWLGILRHDVLSEIWCYYWYLCSSPVPSYFIIILICLVALPFLIFALRNQTTAVTEIAIKHDEFRQVSKAQARVGLGYQIISIVGFIVIVGKCLYAKSIPGWELVYVWIGFMAGFMIESIPPESIRDWWKKDGEFWLAMLIAHVSLIGLLVGIYGKPDLLWSTIVLAVLASANLRRFRRQVPFIFWIISLAMVVFTIGINDWWTAAIGDEYIFHQQAWVMSDIMSYQDVGRLIFSAESASGQHTYFSSFIQVLFMKFLGSESFGWRFSNIYLCTLSVGLFYLFCKSFISKRVSQVAAFLFAVSSYIMAFSKIGYNNLQALFCLTLVLALATWVLRSESKLAFVSLGSALALCFYVYPAALYAIPLPLILLSVYRFPRKKEAVGKWALMFLVSLALIFPLMMQPIYWGSKAAGTLFNQPAILQTTSSLAKHFFENLFYSFFSFLYAFAESHFVAASYVDPLTGAFILIGLFVLIFQAQRQRFPLFILFCFIYFVIIIGTSHDRQFPPHTRMFLLLPVYMLIAAWGITWVAGCVKQLFTVNKRLELIVQVGLIMAFTGLNLYQAYPLSHYRFAHTQMIESLFIRLSENVQAAEPRTTKTYAVLLDENWSVEGFQMMQKTYPHLAWAQIKQVQISEPVLPESSKPMLMDRDTIIIIMPWMDAEWVKALDTPLREMGKKPCEVLSYTGKRLTTLYHAPNLPQACYP